MGVITFNGITSTSVGVQVAHPPKFVYPERDSEAVHVPGRNGDIIIDKDSYKNVPREYELTVYDQAHPDWTYHERMTKLSNWLHSARGYAKLSDTYDAGYFRKARYVEQAEEFENFIEQGGTGTITFDCRPERFLDSGDVSSTITSNTTFTNPTQYDSKPYLKITSPDGNSNLTCTLSIDYTNNQSGSDAITVVRITGAQVSSGQCWVIVDSDLQVVLSNSTSPFTYTLPEGFPIFKPGFNRILVPSSVGSVEVIPRWYTI